MDARPSHAQPSHRSLEPCSCVASRPQLAYRRARFLHLGEGRAHLRTRMLDRGCMHVPMPMRTCICPTHRLELGHGKASRLEQLDRVAAAMELVEDETDVDHLRHTVPRLAQLTGHVPGCTRHGTWGMGHGAWGMGHGAWGMGHGDLAWPCGMGVWHAAVGLHAHAYMHMHMAHACACAAVGLRARANLPPAPADAHIQMQVCACTCTRAHAYGHVHTSSRSSSGEQCASVKRESAAPDPRALSLSVHQERTFGG